MLPTVQEIRPHDALISPIYDIVFHPLGIMKGEFPSHQYIMRSSIEKSSLIDTCSVGGMPDSLLW